MKLRPYMVYKVCICCFILERKSMLTPGLEQALCGEGPPCYCLFFAARHIPLHRSSSWLMLQVTRRSGLGTPQLVCALSSELSR